jgi:PAS domain-containing protein
MARRSGARYRSTPPAPDAANEAVLDALYEATTSPTLVLDVVDGGQLLVRWVNRSAERSGLLLGSSCVGRLVEEVLRGESAAALRAGYTESLQLGEPCAYEEFIEIDGAETWWMTTVAPVLGSDARPVRLVASFLRLDFMRRVERALVRAEANFRALIERGPTPRLLLGQDGLVVYGNAAASRLFSGEGRPRLAGRSMAELVDPANREGLLDWLKRALDSDGDVPTLRVRMSPADDDTRAMLLTSIRVSVDGGTGVLIEVLP